MEKLQLKKQQFKNALESLKEVLDMPYSVVVRDATIQRFEYTFELCWKTLSLYFKEIHGIICRSPKKCFREGLSLELYDESITEILLKMVDHRNQTVHIYNELIAEEIYKQIVEKYYIAMRKIYDIMG